MFKEFLFSVRLILATVVICVFAYPIAILLVASVVVPESRLGSLIVDDEGRVIGSRLIAQGFTRPDYFWPRPSACDYNAAAAAGSNLSPANPAIRERANAILKRLEPAEGQAIPADLVTASGGGLDPHVSSAAAMLQASRVAKARGIDDTRVRKLVEEQSEQIPLTSDEESRIVNILKLNLALDRISLDD